MNRTFAVGGVFALMLLTVATSAMAGTTIGSSHPRRTSQTVAVGGTVGPFLELTLDTNVVNLGDLTPGVPTDSAAVGITVKSNRSYDFATAIDEIGTADLNLSTRVGDKSDEAKGIKTYRDVYSVDVPFGTGPGTLSAHVTYTAVQR